MLGSVCDMGDVIYISNFHKFSRTLVDFSTCAESFSYTLCASSSPSCLCTIYFPLTVRSILTKTEYIYIYIFPLNSSMSPGVD